MRVAFVSANREKMPDAVIPLGLLSVMAATPARHERVLVDLCFEEEPQAALSRALRSFAPELVAVGLRNVQSNDYSGVSDNLTYYAALMRTIRASTDAPVVLGGGGFSVLPEALIDTLGADFGISGEGELAFPALLEALEGARPLARVPGLVRREDGRVVSAPRAASVDLDALPPIDRRLVDPRYYERYGIDSIQTKRGCALHCDYCTYPTIEGAAIRKRAPARVADELERIARAHPAVRHVFVVDSVFNLPASHARDVCLAMIERGSSLPWTCYANPIAFDEELAALIARAGCAGMEIGSDSGCDEILARLKKGFDTQQIRRIHAIAKAAGIPDCHTFVLGTPGETIEHVRRTLDFVVELDPFAAILLPWVDDHESVDPDQRARRRALRDEIVALLAETAPRYPFWIMPSIGVSFDERTFDALRAHGHHGPLWQHIRMRSTRPRRAALARRTATPSPERS